MWIYKDGYYDEWNEWVDGDPPPIEKKGAAKDEEVCLSLSESHRSFEILSPQKTSAFFASVELCGSNDYWVALPNAHSRILIELKSNWHTIVLDSAQYGL